MGNGTMTGALADFLAAIMNSNLAVGNHVAPQVEAQVIDWMKTLLCFPDSASGLLVSGGSMANFTGLAVARNAKSKGNIRQNGLQSQPLRFYASTEVHSCNQKALELLGLGSEALHLIAVNEDLTINIEALQQAIDDDRQAGYQPVCIIGTPGTVNTGAIDNLSQLAKVCQQQDLWFHVDGAIGAVAVLADSVKEQLIGIERADSVALDLHKWLHIPFEAGCVLVRDHHAHLDTFSLTPAYLERDQRGLAAGTLWFSDYGLQLSRQFRALKVWMSIKEHGLDRFGRLIDRNIAQANYLGELIAQHPSLELLAPISLDIVCFRFVSPTMPPESLDALNKEIVIQLQEQGIAAPSYTWVRDRCCIRVAIANYRSQLSDFDLLVEQVIRIGRQQLKPSES